MHRTNNFLRYWITGGISTRKLAKKFKCDHSYIVKTIKRKTDIQYRKKLYVPYRTDTQKSVIHPKCGRSLQKFRNHEFIIDDESYFTFSNSEAKTGDDLKNMIKYCLKKVDMDLVHRMVSSVPSNLDHVRRHGIE